MKDCVGSPRVGRTLSSLFAVAVSLFAASQAAAEESAAQPDDIIVTGTRSTTRTVATSLAPIDVLSAQVLEKSGRQSVRDLLATLVPSVNLAQSGSGAAFAVKTVSLRGLGTDQTLILVNGKRRHNTATLFINGATQNGQSPADLDLIPVSAIERIEVLRDGAAAQYGSDAIAGVINVILKSQPEGLDVSYLAGVTGGGDGVTDQALGRVGFRLGEGGHLSLSAAGLIQQRTDRGTLNNTQRFFPINGAPDPREATFDRHNNHPGSPNINSVSLAYDAALPIAADTELYSFGTYARRRANSYLVWRNANQPTNIPEIYPLGFVPKLDVNDDDYQFVAGVRRRVSDGLSWDLSSSYSRDQVRYGLTNSLNASLGPVSPTSFYLGKVVAREWTTNLDVTDKVDLLFADPLLVAVGAEYRKNWYSIAPGEPASYVDGGYRSPTGPLAGVFRSPGSQGLTGFQPSLSGDFSRHDWAVYLNLEQTIVPGFDVAFAGRYEDYSDAGDTATGKASARFEPVRGIALRGTISTGFRAPTLQQQHYASSSTQPLTVPGVGILPVQVQALPVSSAAAIALGAKPLTPEKSTNYSVGLVLSPTSRLNVTVDAYKIDIRDRILLTGTLIGPAVSAALAQAGLAPNQGGFYFSNAADTSTKGLDIVVTWHSDVGDLGTIDWSLAANFNKTRFTHIESPPPALAAAGLVLIDRVRQGDFTVGNPHNKIVGGIDWQRGPLGVNLRVTRYGRVIGVSSNPPTATVNYDSVAKAKVIADLDISYQLTPAVKFSVGANNLFNTYPTPTNSTIRTGPSDIGFAYYNSYSPFGFNGGFYYGRLSFNF